MSDTNRLVWAEPIRQEADAMRDDAGKLRMLLGDSDLARLLDQAAARVEGALGRAEHGEWVRLDYAAEALGVTQATLRARCRRTLQAERRARREGGLWYVHASVLASAQEAA